MKQKGQPGSWAAPLPLTPTSRAGREQKGAGCWAHVTAWPQTCQIPKPEEASEVERMTICYLPPSELEIPFSRWETEVWGGWTTENRDWRESGLARGTYREFPSRIRSAVSVCPVSAPGDRGRGTEVSSGSPSSGQDPSVQGTFPPGGSWFSCVLLQAGDLQPSSDLGGTTDRRAVHSCTFRRGRSIRPRVRSLGRHPGPGEVRRPFHHQLGDVSEGV